MDLDELDLTSAESKAAYEEIKAYVLEHTGLKVSYFIHRPGQAEIWHY